MPDICGVGHLRERSEWRRARCTAARQAGGALMDGDLGGRAPARRPHILQKRASASAAVPHWVQNWPSGGASARRRPSARPVRRRRAAGARRGPARSRDGTASAPVELLHQPRVARARSRSTHLVEVGVGDLAHRVVELQLLDRAQHQVLLPLERGARASARPCGARPDVTARRAGAACGRAPARVARRAHRERDERDGRRGGVPDQHHRPVATMSVAIRKKCQGRPVDGRRRRGGGRRRGTVRPRAAIADRCQSRLLSSSSRLASKAGSVSASRSLRGRPRSAGLAVALRPARRDTPTTHEPRWPRARRGTPTRAG